MPRALRLLPICMVDLLHKDTAVDARGTAGPPPREPDHQGQAAAEPQKRRLCVSDAGIARILVGSGCCRDRHLREAVEERYDLAWTGRATGCGARTVGVLDLSIRLIPALLAMVCGHRPDGW
jgi:hypothetical protein